MAGYIYLNKIRELFVSEYNLKTTSLRLTPPVIRNYR